MARTRQGMAKPGRAIAEGKIAERLDRLLAD